MTEDEGPPKVEVPPVVFQILIVAFALVGLTLSAALVVASVIAADKVTRD